MKSFECFFERKEVEKLLNTSTPILTNDLGLLEIKAQVEYGEFSFYFKNFENKNFVVHLDCCSDVSQILNLFVALIKNEPKHIEEIENDGCNAIFYTECLDKNQIRFFIANDYELYDKFVKTNEDYTYESAKIDMDIIIDKKIFIKTFYEQLKNYLIDLDNIEFVPYGNEINIDACKKCFPVINEYLAN